MRPIFPVLIFLAWPIAEIAGFAYVGAKIGVFNTVLLVLLAMVLGVAVLRYQGLSAFRKINRDVQTGRAPEAGIVHGFLIMIAAILLIVPGFISDIIGLLLLIPFVRSLVWTFAAQNLVIRYSAGKRGSRGRYRSDYVDLSPEDYRRNEDERDDPKLRRPD